MSNHYSYMWLEQIQRVIRMQSDKILRMENEIVELKRLIQNIQETPKQTIGSIEYKFDQLKVENLNGTLIIGLRHGESGEIEDMWIADKHQESVAFGQQSNDHAGIDSDSIRNEIHQYIHKDVSKIIQGQANQHQVNLDSENLRSIIEDMSRQANERIGLYMKQGEDRAEIKRKIQNDLLMSVNSYLDYFGLKAKPDQSDKHGS